MINENIYMNFVNLSLSLIVPLQKYNKYYGDHLDDLMFFFLLIDVSSSADVCWLFVVCDVMVLVNLLTTYFVFLFSSLLILRPVSTSIPPRLFCPYDDMMMTTFFCKIPHLNL